MRHKYQEEQGDPGGDSFLDVVSNIVGILIILVMVVGAKIKEAPVNTAEEKTTATATAVVEKPKADVVIDRTIANSLAENVMALREQIVDVQTVSLANQREAERLSTLVEIGKRDINRQKSKLDQKKQRDFEMNQLLIAEKTKLDQLQRDLLYAASQEPKEIKVKSYPTPISKSVFSNEEHYRLLGGRIVRIPFNELQEALVNEKRQLIWKLKDLPEVSGMIGPVGGFRLYYHFRRHRTGASLSQAIFRATAPKLGEPFQQALQKGSTLNRQLSKLDPRSTTITIWTYPDSFAEFRKLKKELYNRGFAIAARPVFKDGPIGFSPHGSRSSAQ